MLALIVDDAAETRMILRKILEPTFRVIEAENGREALDSLVNFGKVDLAVVDWSMPEMDGFELVRAIRNYKRFDKIKILAVTAATDKALVEQMLQAGADEYLMKPFDPDMVRDKLRLMGFYSKDWPV